MNKKKWLLILDIAALLGMITLISVTGYNTFMIWRLQDQMKINTELTADIIAKQILDSRKPPAKK